jgi:hypothetical protein
MKLELLAQTIAGLNTEDMLLLAKTLAALDAKAAVKLTTLLIVYEEDTDYAY